MKKIILAVGLTILFTSVVFFGIAAATPPTLNSLTQQLSNIISYIGTYPETGSVKADLTALKGSVGSDAGGVTVQSKLDSLQNDVKKLGAVVCMKTYMMEFTHFTSDGNGFVFATDKFSQPVHFSVLMELASFGGPNGENVEVYYHYGSSSWFENYGTNGTIRFEYEADQLDFRWAHRTDDAYIGYVITVTYPAGTIITPP